MCYPTQLQGRAHLCKLWNKQQQRVGELESFNHWEALKMLFLSGELWVMISVTLLILFCCKPTNWELYIYSIHHWSIFTSSYRKLAWVGFECTFIEFCSDALTDWAIRPWVQLELRANIAQLLQAAFLFSVHVSFVYHI